jgi:ABC-type branched-subunit amino acid transport system substrate-binding protein
VKNYNQLGLKTLVTGPPAVATPEFLKIAGSIVEGNNNFVFLSGKIVVAEKLPLTDPWRKNLYEPFKKIMREKYGPKPITVFHSVGRDAMEIVLKALSTAGSDDRAAIRNALETIKIEGQMGPYACSPTDHRGIIVQNGPGVVVKNGEYVPYK